METSLYRRLTTPPLFSSPVHTDHSSCSPSLLLQNPSLNLSPLLFSASDEVDVSVEADETIIPPATSGSSEGNDEVSSQELNERLRQLRQCHDRDVCIITRLETSIKEMKSEMLVLRLQQQDS